MTLLVAMPRREVFHLAVDSLLTRNRRRVGASPKRTDLSYDSLHGIASYTGVAALSRDAVETSDWIADVLAVEKVGRSPRFDDLVEVLASESTRRFGSSRFPLTILMPAVEHGKPVLGMVSNSRTLDKAGALRAHFAGSIRRSWEPDLFTLGTSDAVETADRELLETLARVRLPSRFTSKERERFEGYVQRTMREVVVRASASDTTDTIGRDATAWTLTLSGLSGGGRGPFAPTAGPAPGNVFGRAGLLFRKHNRGEMTSDEVNDALQEAMGWEKVRTLPDGTRVFKQGGSTLKLPPSQR